MTPYNIIDVAGEVDTIYATTLPDLSSASIEIVDSLSLNVFWEGYTIPCLYYTERIRRL
jgi:hypothetical protein